MVECPINKPTNFCASQILYEFSSVLLQKRPWRRHGGMALQNFGKTPPNRGGVAGCLWKRYGGHGGIVDFFILKNVRDKGWADPTQPYPSFSSSAARPATVSSATNDGAGIGNAHDNRR